MQAQTVLLSCLLALGYAASTGRPNDPECGVNEVYTECKSACTPNCTVPNVICAKNCAGAGCQCAPGYLRGPQGTCISADECPEPECGENEHYSGCTNACFVATCTYTPRICPMYCKLPGGCVCDSGFVRGPDGNCIDPAECPANSTAPSTLSLCATVRCANGPCAVVDGHAVCPSGQLTVAPPSA